MEIQELHPQLSAFFYSVTCIDRCEVERWDRRVIDTASQRLSRLVGDGDIKMGLPDQDDPSVRV